jgi:phage regulator Rha-like protein
MSITLANVKGQLLVDSRIVADNLGVQHDNFIQTITTYRSQIEELGVFRFETEKPVKGSTGRPQRFCYLNENQSVFVMTLSRNTAQVVQFKLSLVKAFSKAKEQKTSFESIASEKDWDKLRTGGVKYRLTFTDRIKDAGGKGLDYAKATNEIYIGATGLDAKQLKQERGIVKSKPARDGLDLGELQIVAMTEWHLSEALPEGSSLPQINQASRTQAERLKAALMVF